MQSEDEETLAPSTKRIKRARDGETNYSLSLSPVPVPDSNTRITTEDSDSANDTDSGDEDSTTNTVEEGDKSSVSHESSYWGVQMKHDSAIDLRPTEDERDLRRMELNSAKKVKERARRGKMSESVRSLRHLVPACLDEKKVNQSQVLANTVTYITKIQSQITSLQRENEKLRHALGSHKCPTPDISPKSQAPIHSSIQPPSPLVASSAEMPSSGARGRHTARSSTNTSFASSTSSRVNRAARLASSRATKNTANQENILDSASNMVATSASNQRSMPLEAEPHQTTYHMEPSQQQHYKHISTITSPSGSTFSAFSHRGRKSGLFDRYEDPSSPSSYTTSSSAAIPLSSPTDPMAGHGSIERFKPHPLLANRMDTDGGATMSSTSQSEPSYYSNDLINTKSPSMREDISDMSSGSQVVARPSHFGSSALGSNTAEAGLSSSNANAHGTIMADIEEVGTGWPLLYREHVHDASCGHDIEGLYHTSYSILEGHNNGHSQDQEGEFPEAIAAVLHAPNELAVSELLGSTAISSTPNRDYMMRMTPTRPISIGSVAGDTAEECLDDFCRHDDENANPIMSHPHHHHHHHHQTQTQSQQGFTATQFGPNSPLATTSNANNFLSSSPSPSPSYPPYSFLSSSGASLFPRPLSQSEPPNVNEGGF